MLGICNSIQLKFCNANFGTTIIAARKRSGEKAMFSQVSVCQQVGLLPFHNAMGQADPRPLADPPPFRWTIPL